jgi:hypothetical protein
MKVRSFAILLVAFGACHTSNPREHSATPEESKQTPSTAEHSGPPVPRPTVWFDPSDYTTSVGNAPLRVRIEVLAGSVSERSLSELASTLTLNTWPELSPVPSRTSVVREDSQSSGSVIYHVEKVPNSPLADRWYALRVGALPAGFEWPTFPSHISLPDGAIVSRFRVGSEPRVFGVRKCQRRTASEIFIDFTELVENDQSASIDVLQGDSRLSCERVGATNSEGVGSIALQCPGAISGSLEVSIVLRGGLRSRNGVPVSGSSSIQLRFVPAQMRPWGTGCTIFRP